MKARSPAHAALALEVLPLTWANLQAVSIEAAMFVSQATELDNLPVSLFLKATADHAIALDCAEEHLVRTHPDVAITIKRLIDDQRLQRLAILRDRQYLIPIALEVPEALPY